MGLTKDPLSGMVLGFYSFTLGLIAIIIGVVILITSFALESSFIRTISFIWIVMGILGIILAKFL